MLDPPLPVDLRGAQLGPLARAPGGLTRSPSLPLADRSSFEQNHHWLTFQQYDNLYDPHFYGGGDEGISPYFQYLNGLGCNFFGETTGQGVDIMEYLLAKRNSGNSNARSKA